MEGVTIITMGVGFGPSNGHVDVRNALFIYFVHVSDTHFVCWGKIWTSSTSDKWFQAAWQSLCCSAAIGVLPYRYRAAFSRPWMTWTTRILKPNWAWKIWVKAGSVTLWWIRGCPKNPHRIPCGQVFSVWMAHPGYNYRFVEPFP